MPTKCPTHPDADAVGTCARCGRFFCAPERITLDKGAYCGDCGVRDDVDWLGKHYAKLEGRRSGLAWSVGALSVPLLLLGVVLLLSPSAEGSERGFGLATLVYGLACLATATGREGLHLVMLPASVLAAAGFGAFASNGGVGLLAFGIPAVALAIAVWRDLPTRLFFRKPVPRAELLQHFERGGNNPLATSASRLALLSLFIPGLSLVTLALGVLALTRVDKRKTPPVGGVRIALGAVAFSLFTGLMWASAFIPALMR